MYLKMAFVSNKYTSMQICSKYNVHTYLSYLCAILGQWDILLLTLTSNGFTNFFRCLFYLCLSCLTLGLTLIRNSTKEVPSQTKKISGWRRNICLIKCLTSMASPRIQESFFLGKISKKIPSQSSSDGVLLVLAEKFKPKKQPIS